jgi:hypothetical protein
MTMTIGRSLPPALVAMIVSTLLVGCARGGAPALSHEELVEKANAICASAQERVYKLQLPLGGAMYPATFPDPRFTRFYRKSTALGHATLASLRDLPPPAEDAVSWPKGLSVLESVLRGVDRLARAQAAGDEERYRALVQAPASRTVSATLNRLASLGFPSCAYLGWGPGAGR